MDVRKFVWRLLALMVSIVLYKCGAVFAAYAMLIVASIVATLADIFEG